MPPQVAPPGPVLEVSGARRAFGDRQALAGLDLQLRRREIYALLGRNGAGKTTLVRAVSGRVRLDAGSVRIDGLDPVAEPAARRRLGLVPQELALYPELSAQENLEVFGRLAGLHGRDARRHAREALEWIGLADRATSRVETLSGGMKRRVNLAAGVLHRPDLLLLDEPTVGVDPAARERIHALLADLRRSGMAVLLTTHDLAQAAELADRIGILEEGRLLAEGSLAELVARCFGRTRQLAIRFAEAPAESVHGGLAAAGLGPSADDPRCWSGQVARGLDELVEVNQQLGALGLVALELRLKEPDLHDVFFHLTGRALDAEAA